jgi:DNA repair protein SbcC/Rad50
MRLHSLTVTAFGPFADEVEVDFDTLSDAGLFLLCGATGAGKSSVLDAVCFALYGEVPGDRSSAKRLRCDTAAPGVAPRVLLDVTLGGRRFHRTRSPAWQRPKKRGTGTTAQQASVLVQEVVDGTPQHLTNRLDEAGHLMSGLLGMNMSQFTQVALLPQGRFQDFLRAKSEDRHTLLQKLFRTRRFEDIERWLRDRRIALRRESEGHADGIAGLVHRLDEVSGVPLADEVDDRVIAAAATDGGLIRWAKGAAESAAGAVRLARGELTRCAATTEQSTDALLAGRSLADQQARHARAVAELALLDAHHEAAERHRAVAADARRAAPLAALHQQEARARTRMGDAVASAESATTAAAHLLPPAFGLMDVQDALATAHEAVAAGRAMLPVETELAALTADLSTMDEREAQLRGRIEGLDIEVAALPGSVSAAAADVDAARAAVPALTHAREQIEILHARRTALGRVAELTIEIAGARDQLRAAVDAHLALREDWLALQERRLNGMAAEIATGLAVGDTCPVCGSCDHPHPASPAPGAPTSTEEKAARKRVEDADVIRQAHDERVRNLATLLAVAGQQAGAVGADDLEAVLASAHADATRLATLASGLGPALTRHEQARAALQQATAELAAARLEHASVTTTLGSTRARSGRLRESLEAVMDGHRDLGSAIAARDATAALLASTLDAWRGRDAAAAQLADITADLDQVARECGFDAVASAVAALLSTADLAALEATVATHDEARAAARAMRDDTLLAEAAATAAPDLAALATAQASAADALAHAEATHRTAVEGAGRIEALRTQLLDSLSAWAPVRVAHELAAQVAGFAEGRTADNRAQMRLSAYVLSWRLGQVVDAANLRLSRMTGQRYALEHTALKGAGETRGGLSLLVRDEWSGETRDPVTLSGGETFVVSLALALGLTDVVTQEAGGADVGTLFVDEGFGSLDADTLDDVMDTLDALRDGGRVVGIVSHVPELRTRIPAQLQVDKSRSGSRVRLTHAVA